MSRDEHMRYVAGQSEALRDWSGGLTTAYMDECAQHSVVERPDAWALGYRHMTARLRIQGAQGSR